MNPDFRTTDTIYIGNVPHIITVRPILRAGMQPSNDFLIAQRIAEYLVDRIVREVRAYHPSWNETRIRNHVVIYLNGNNLETGETVGHNTRHTFDDLYVRDITAQKILEIYERMQQSNATIQIYDIEWQVTINSSTLLVGGDRVIKIPKWAPANRYIETWTDHGMNCAAFALTSIRMKQRNMTFKLKVAARLQHEMKWGEFISTSELLNVVTHVDFRRWKIVILAPPMQTHGDFRVGVDYNADGAKNIAYLYFDINQNHFAAMTSPHAYLVHARGNFEWCHTCTRAYPRNSGDHPCVAKKVYVPKVCDDCGRSKGYKHRCGVYECRTCKAVCKYETDMNKAFTHRCPIVRADRDVETDSFYGDDPKRIDAMDGTYPCLITYDIESCFKKMEGTAVRDLGYEVDADFKYTGTTLARGTEFLQHHANLLIAQNVFTGEMLPHFVGLDCIDQFVKWLFANNDGNHICLAHNGSGYDTRLVFSAIKKMSHRKVKLITRGCKIMELRVDKMVFRDSLLHLKNSLKALLVEFKAPMKKGYYPYYFNSMENLHYVGVKPAIENFDVGSSCKSDADYQDFLDYYNSLGRD